MPKLDKIKIIEALKSIEDPLLGGDIVSRNRIREVQIDGSQIRCVLVFDHALEGPQKSALNFSCMELIQSRFPGTTMHVHLETQNDGSAKSVLPQVKNIIAVASGKGGVGKSTVSTNLALGLKATGAKVGILDADLYGPSIPTMLGLLGQRPKVKDIYGKTKLLPLEAHGLSVMSIGFIIEPEQAVVLRGPRLGGIIKQFVQECLWPDLDYLIIDLPPGTGDIQLTLVQTLPLTGAIIVTTPQSVAYADALKAMNMFRLPTINVPILGVLENMSWFTPPELPEKKYFLFGKGGGLRLSTESESELIGQIPLVQDIMDGGEAGLPVILNTTLPEIQSLWSNIAQRVTELVDERNRKLDPTKIVQTKT